MRGKLILIEGLDRSGKSTQAELLRQHLNGVLLKFPARETHVGKLINAYLTDASVDIDDHALHLLFQANRWELKLHIEELLASGTSVVLDRYFYSGLAYTLAKKTINDVAWLYSGEIGLPQPDLTIFLSLSMDAIRARAGFGDERYENVDFQAQVKEKFLDVLRFGKNVSVLEVEDDSIDVVEAKIWNLVEKLPVPTDLEYLK